MIKLLRRNFRYKILALTVAIVIWAYANQGINPTIMREIRVPLDIRNVDTTHVVTDAPSFVRVTVEGPRSQVEFIAAEPDSVKAYVNLQDKAEGRHIVPVIARPPDGYINSVAAYASVRDIAVSLEKRAQKSLTVTPQFAGSPPVGYRFGQPQLSPTRVTVSGTKDHVDRVEQVVFTVDTEFVGEEGIRGDFRVAAMDRNGKQVQEVQLTPDKINLRMELLEAPASRAVFVSVDTAGQPPFPHRVAGIEVYPQTVTITGRPETLVNITSLKTEPIQLSNRTRTFTERVEIIPRAGVTFADGKEVRVTVRIESPEQAPPAAGQSDE